MSFEELVDSYLVSLREPSSCVVSWSEGKPIYIEDKGTYIETTYLVPIDIRSSIEIGGVFYVLKTSTENKETAIDKITDKINSSF